MSQKTQTQADKLAEVFLEAMAEFLEAAGFVKVGGVWRSADDLKADAL